MIIIPFFYYLDLIKEKMKLIPMALIIAANLFNKIKKNFLNDIQFCIFLHIHICEFQKQHET